MRKLYTLILPVLVFLVSACEKEKSEAEIPSYIHIDSISLVTNYSLQGSNSQNISDAWVYVNNKLIGAYELPATLPVLESGPQTVEVLPGIKVNGIAATRSVYPLYTRYRTEVDLKVDEVVTIQPQVTYQTWATIPWFEDFETGAPSFIETTRSDTIMYRTNEADQVFEGNKSGIVTLTSEKDFFEATTDQLFVLPHTDKAIFIEMDFKTNNIVSVGLFAHEGTNLIQRPLVHLNNTNNEWKKIYINLTSAVNDSPNANAFSFFIGIQKEDGVEQAVCLFDNLKLVY